MCQSHGGPPPRRDSALPLSKSNCISESIRAVRFRQLMGHSDGPAGVPSITSTQRTPRRVSSGTSHTVLNRPLAVRCRSATSSRSPRSIRHSRRSIVGLLELGLTTSSIPASGHSLMACGHGQGRHQNISTDIRSGALLSPREPRKAFLSMHVLSPVLAVSALAAMSVPVHALDAWTVGVERGLPTYALTSEAGEVRLVCDPDRVFGPTPHGVVVVPEKAGGQAPLPVKNGIAAQASVDAADWSKMVATFRTGGEFAMVTSADSLTFKTAPLPDLACE